MKFALKIVFKKKKQQQVIKMKTKGVIEDLKRKKKLKKEKEKKSKE